MIPYADTNFFTRAYLSLPNSPKADALLLEAKRLGSRPLAITWLHRLEVMNAFQIHVFLSREAGQTYVSPEQAALAYANFRSDAENSDFLRPIALPGADVEHQFEELALRHTAKHGFRVYDILHVTCALLLQCDTFWSFDPKASKLAALEGLNMLK